MMIDEGTKSNLLIFGNGMCPNILLLTSMMTIVHGMCGLPSLIAKQLLTYAWDTNFTKM
jgi:hypothetical protein